MTADITWLLLAPGRAMRSRQNTPGSMSMRVDLPETGTMIFTADAVYMGASYGPPAVPAAIVNNLEQFYSSVEKLRAIGPRRMPPLCSGMTPNRSSSCASHPKGTTADGGRERY
ncbi:MAG TPA: hypothetical protein VF951_10320 [Streptosporangiaceae bacterium]